MLEIFLMAQLLTMETPGCEETREMPPAISRILQNGRGAVVEIQEKTLTGYISSIFIHSFNNVVYLEGWFFETDLNIIACEIDFVLERDEEGRVLFVWHRDQKES